MATPTAAPPLLNLDTLHAATSVIIDETPYRILAPDGLSLMAYRQIRPLIVQLEVLRAQDTLTKAQQAEEVAALKGICLLVLEAPSEVHKKLDDMQRLLIYQTFLELPSSTLQLLGAKGLIGAGQTPRQSTGAPSSPDLPGSIQGAVRSSGSRASRKRSSGPTS